MMMPALYMIHFALSLGAIFAVIPIIIIIILILAARGAAGGTDLFAMFGINTLLGAQKTTSPGSRKGFGGKSYRANTGATKKRAEEMGKNIMGHKSDVKPVGGQWKKATEIVAYSPVTGKPVLGLDEKGRLSRLDEEGKGILLDVKGDRVPAFGQGLQKSAARGLDWVGLGATMGILTQRSILPKDADIDDVIDRTNKKQGKSILGLLRAQQDNAAADANFMLERLSPEQLNAAVMHFSPSTSATDPQADVRQAEAPGNNEDGWDIAQEA